MHNNLKRVVGIILLLMLVLAAVSAFFQWHRGATIQQQVAETRRTLHEQGFKTDLADFNFATDADTGAREGALTFFSGSVQPRTAVDIIELLPPATGGSAVAIWKQDWLEGEEGSITWSDVHDTLEENRPQLDAACDAALSGPIQFYLEANAGRSMLLRHLAPLKRLGQTLGVRTMAELHDGHRDAAWTNWLALTRLATAWKVEPAEVSHMVRFELVNVGFDVSWQALQNGQWSDEQLAALQEEWATADFFTNLPETIAFQRASDVALCRQQRDDPMAGGPPFSEIIKEAGHSPGIVIMALKESWNAARYRSFGTYDDERNMLLFYQKREVEMRRAIAAPTWAQMQALPGVTNAPMFTSPYHSRLTAMINIQAMRTRFLKENTSLLSRAAEAETRRRIIVAALALERFHGKHGAYLQTLAELAPEFLKAVPVDFMDGQPLRYRPTDDGHFVLYSVGLDGVDDGGALPAPAPDPRRRRMAALGMAAAGPSGDIVWPRPATAAEVESLHQTQVSAVQDKADSDEDREAAWLWQHTVKRQAGVGSLLAAPPITDVPDINFNGRPLSETLRNPSGAGTNKFSLTEMFTLKQVITGGEPESITFELPIAYDAATNAGDLIFMIDPNYETGDEEGSGAQQVEYTRATNGDFLVVWHTIYESPGEHVLQATLWHSNEDKPDVAGPLLPFVITNLCQFSLGSATYDVELGARFHARVPEPKASYAIECVTTNGAHLKTLTGNTTNGEFNVRWNLVDDHGHRLGGETFNSIVHITLPDSGRSQTMRGP